MLENVSTKTPNQNIPFEYSKSYKVYDNMITVLPLDQNAEPLDYAISFGVPVTSTPQEILKLLLNKGYKTGQWVHIYPGESIPEYFRQKLIRLGRSADVLTPQNLKF